MASQSTPVPLRLGLCGIGRTGFGRIRTELDGLLGSHFVLAAGFDQLYDRAVKLQSLFPTARAYQHFEGLLADPSVDVVVIATRSDSHAALATEALCAGKHVVVEKPMAINLAETDALLAVAARSAGRLFVRLNRRFDPSFQAVTQAIACGRVGRIHSVQIRAGEYVRRNDWQTLRKFGGGQLLNWGPHVIDWALELIGGAAVHIWADTRLIAAAGDAEDHVKLILRGPDGAIADIEVSGANAARQPLFVVQGDRGAVWADAESASSRHLKVPFDRTSLQAEESTPPQDDRRYKALEESDWIQQSWPVPSGRTGSYWSAVYQSIREQSPFPIDLGRAREVMRVIEVARAQSNGHP